MTAAEFFRQSESSAALRSEAVGFRVYGVLMAGKRDARRVSQEEVAPEQIGTAFWT